MEFGQFQRLLAQKGEELYREMPWRDDTRPYFVFVSELMLQQTQVSRVVPKFEVFISQFPDEQSLAEASLADVLKLWQGLGYNRRAKFLHESAKTIVSEFGGNFPETEIDITKLPGVGKDSAGAIRAYAFNQPAIFVETNIRTVYIHHFFADKFDISDAQIIELLKKTIDRKNPRRFYQNLMDYGSWLKANGVRNISNSKHYKKQSPLKGSLREMRGAILHELASEPQAVQFRGLKEDTRFHSALDGLLRDSLIQKQNDTYYLTGSPEN